MDDMPLVMLAIVWYVTFVFSTTIHEAAHAFVAWKLGDPTGYRAGSVSLDPTPHMRREPIGMIVVPLISLMLSRGASLMGWASCPYDPHWALSHPRRAALMALAGPVSNFLQFAIAALLLRWGVEAQAFALDPDNFHTYQIVVGAGEPWTNAAAIGLSVIFTLNLFLGLFNLLPVPPLDGGAVLMLFLPDREAERWQSLLWNPSFQMMGMVTAFLIFPKLFAPVFGRAALWVVQGAM